MTDQNKIYKIRALADKANHLMYQFSRESGLKLAPYVYKESELLAINLYHVVEVIGADAEAYPYEHYKYDEHTDIFSISCYDGINRSMVELRSTASERAKLLEEFQHAWDRVQDHGEGVQVHYGLHFASIWIPLETIHKYAMFLRNASWEKEVFAKPTSNEIYLLDYASTPLEIINVREYGGGVFLLYGWDSSALVAFDNRSDYLGWKVSEYRKTGHAKEDLLEFCDNIRAFQTWEKTNFLASTAPR